MLQEPAMKFVCRLQILLKKPGAVRWHIIHCIELITQKCRRHETHALLRDFCTYRVHVAEGRHDPVKEVTTLRRLLNPALLTHAGRWRWRPHFPHQRSSMFRVRGEESVQHAGAAARQPDNKQRLADLLARNVWVKLPVPLHFQTRTQCLQNIDLQSNFPDQIKPCLVPAGIKQTRQRFKKLALTKIIESAASFGSPDQVRSDDRS